MSTTPPPPPPKSAVPTLSIAVLIVITAFVLLAGLWSVQALDRIDDSNTRRECTSKLSADVLIAFAELVSVDSDTTPEERSAAREAIGAAGRRLEAAYTSDEVC